ncbi:hypothetical protein PYW08_006745 [Mythimna loreyi]|uniref:Uncharacterized protein n=1 Tax=Mythimna loreyi TaxID=667449 RepID=A0ACC2RAH0_9NEOP|nr:hypothetical protein PYW08_006745 [Mythimna loreyi]
MDLENQMPCDPPKTNVEKKWPYVEYYIGERDEENRKHGQGTHHWSGAESLEWYTGQMLNNTMHGSGDYRWRYLGADHLATTYEGRFYNNSMHGYGVISYPNGSVFSGLFHKNYRLGPGVDTYPCLQENVGFWHGYQLIRLAWRPPVPSVAIDLVSTPVGANTVAPHRVLLKENVKIIGEVNSALELLKRSGCEPRTAANKWPKLYSKNCTDLSSPICHVEAFDRAYYDNGISTLSEVTADELAKEGSQSSTNNNAEKTIYYAWNNNKITIYMMKHCYTHEEQRHESRINLEKILSGSRSSFKKPGKHEMDCRTILMASYLGNISNVATLINECDVNPNVTDAQGNSVLMYAACGDQPETIHFLVEASADVDAYNDACCTPLGIALLRYVLEKRGVAYNAMLQALLPPPTAERPPRDESILEWKINRECHDSAGEGLIKVTSKTNYKQSLPTKKNSAKELSMRRKTEQMSKLDIQLQKPSNIDIDTITDSFAKDKYVHDKINTEYLIKVAEAFSVNSEVNPIPYIFEVYDMYKDVEALHDEESRKLAEKSMKKIEKSVSKPTMKEFPKKPSREVMYQEKEDPFVDAIEQKRQEKMARIMLTILQLLSEGADPRKARCPQPPLFIAAVSECAELVRHLINHGADIHEVLPQAYSYTPLDVAVSGPLTSDNLEVIRALLQNGANPDHKLKVPLPPVTSAPADLIPDIIVEEGPTLLHAVLARKIDSENPQLVELRQQLLELLLQYGCNPNILYKGHSAVDLVLNRNLELFDIFLKSPRTDLNAIINDYNQTILVKMFHLSFSKTIPLQEKLQMLTNLLLFGADPLIKCQNGTEEYGNLFAFIKSIFIEKDIRVNNEVPKKSKIELKTKKNLKPTGSKTSTKTIGAGTRSQIKSGKVTDESHADYRQAVDVVVECARLLYIRWLQAKLMKDLIEVVSKYKRRHWTMIIKEHNNKKCTSLWLTANRGLEIWDVLKTTKKKIYDNESILKKVLCIIHFYTMRTKILRDPVNVEIKIWLDPPITFGEKEYIEHEVARLTRAHHIATVFDPNMVPAIRPYVTPELTVKGVEKFNICFECALPLGDVKIPCDSCNLVGFCSFECIKVNIDRYNCHPCSSYLKEKYFPTPVESETNSEEIKQYF